MRPYKLPLNLEKTKNMWIDLDCLESITEPCLTFDKVEFFEVSFELMFAFRNDKPSISFYLNRGINTLEKAELFKKEVFDEIYKPLWTAWTGQKYNG